MKMADKKPKKLKAKKDVNNTRAFKAKSIVPSKSARGFTTKKPPKVHLSYPL